MLSTSRFATRLMLTTLVAVCSPLAAGQGRWTQTGPVTAFVYNMIADPAEPSVLWVSAGGGGVFRSVDGGVTWESRSTGITNDPVYQVELDPNDPHRMWAVGFDAVYDSQDGGASWQPVANCGSTPPWAMAVDPRPNGAIWVVTWTEVVVSRDRGRTWEVALSRWPGSGTDTLYPVTVTLDPSDPDRVFVLDSLSVLLRTEDGGVTWSQSGSQQIDFGDAFDVAVDPFDPQHVLLVARSARIYESRDSGAHLEMLVQLPVGSVGSLVFDPGRQGVVLAFTSYGLWRSTDGGATWSPALAPSEADLDTAASVGADGGLLGAGPSGFYQSGDGGAAWSWIGAGPSAASATSLVADPRSATGVWVGTWNRGVYHSTDCGRTWSWLSEEPENAVVTLAVDPLDPATVYAGTWSSGIMKTTDGGATWTPIFQLPLEDWGVLSTRQIVVKASGQRRLWLVTSNDGIHWSGDGGVSWTKASSDRLDRPYALAVDPFDPEVLLAAAYPYGVLRSADEGDTWEVAHTGLDATPEVLTADPSAAGVYWAGARGGRVFRTGDRGDSWYPLAPLPSTHDVTAIRLDPAHPRTVWVATEGDGAFLTRDGGVTWSRVGRRPRVGDFTALLECGDALLAASDGGGVWSLEPAPPRQPSKRVQPSATTAHDAARSGPVANSAGR